MIIYDDKFYDIYKIALKIYIKYNYKKTFDECISLSYILYETSNGTSMYNEIINYEPILKYIKDS